MRRGSICYIILVTGILGMAACENREVHTNDEEEGNKNTFNDMPVEGIETHFNKIVVDGVEYLILERDRNHPHEGFGFMAFRANQLLEKQDSILAYLKVQAENQAEILSILKSSSYAREKSTIDNKIRRILREE